MTGAEIEKYVLDTKNEALPVTIITNFSGLSNDQVERRAKGSNQTITMPSVIKQYSGSVEFRKCYWNLFTNLLNVCVVNSFTLYMFIYPIISYRSLAVKKDRTTKMPRSPM